MDEKMKELESILDSIQERDDLIVSEPDEDGKYFFDGNCDNIEMSKIENLACDLFINSRGNADYGQISIFNKNSNYRVFAGETDSFGWLTGCIQKKTGEKRPIFVFG